jgi:hypothetical protein
VLVLLEAGLAAGLIRPQGCHLLTTTGAHPERRADLHQHGFRAPRLLQAMYYLEIPSAASLPG